MSEQSSNSPVVAQIVNSAAPAVSTEAPASAATAPEATPTPAPGVDEFASRFAALSRQEKKFQEQQQKAKAEAEKYAKYIDLDKKAKEDPLSVLQTYGMSLDDIIAASLGHQKAPQTVEEQLAELKAQLQAEKDGAKAEAEAKLKAEQDAYQASIDEAILSHQNSIIEHLSKNTDKYELISLHGVQDLVWDTTEAYYEAHQKVLSPEEAANMVEDYLVEQTLKASNLAKLKQKLQPEQQVKVNQESKKGLFQETPINPMVREQQPKTLSQSLASTAPDKQTSERLSPEESKQRAAEFLKKAWAQKS